MNYKTIYDNLILKALSRTFPDGSYYEVHHILPRCMGGSDLESNLVKLTASEHYVAHQLLVKINPTVPGLVYAAMAMSGNPYGERSNNKVYSWLKKKQSELRKGIPLAKETKIKMSKTHTGRPGRKSESENAKKMALSNKGRKHTEQSRRNMSESQKGKTIPEEQRKKMSEAAKAYHASAPPRKKRGPYKPRYTSTTLNRPFEMD
jgi:RNase P/RNase MRP subunit POP5